MSYPDPATTDWVPLAAGTDTPSGAGMLWFSNTPPPGWAILNGQTITNAQTLYPALWANVDPAWKSGANIVLPDMRKRFPIGAGTGLALAANEGLAEASRGVTHRHTVNDPTHAHSINDPTHAHAHTVGSAAGGGNAQSGPDQDNPPKFWQGHSASGTGISIYAAATGVTVGPGGTPLDGPTHIAVNFIIKL